VKIVAAAAAAGLRLNVRQVFKHSSIAELAQAAPEARLVAADQGRVLGDTPLTPIQRTALGRLECAPDGFLSQVVLPCRVALDPQRVAETLRHLVDHHDALRLRLDRDPEGNWRQATGADTLVVVETFEGLEPDAIGEHLRRLGARLELARGCNLAVSLLNAEDPARRAMAIIVNHLVFGPGCLDIFIADFDTAYAQLDAGEPVALPRKTTSYQAWARALTHYAESDGFETDSRIWRHSSPSPLPPDYQTVTPADDRAWGHYELTVPETRRLLDFARSVPAASTREVLLSGFLEAYRRVFGVEQLPVMLVDQGRSSHLPDIDVSRTIGWFSTEAPVILRAEGAWDWARRAAEAGRAWTDMAEIAFAYGVGRELSQRAPLDDRDSVRFNYLGVAAEPGRTRYLDPRELPVERMHRYTLRPSPNLVFDVVMSLEQDRLRAAAVARHDVAAQHLTDLMKGFFDLLRG
jgi:hypothetical protein